MKMKLIYLIAFLFNFLASVPVVGQKLLFNSYTVEDGLVSNPVRRIYQDKRGFLWIATWEGLSKYDGHKFTNYTVATGLSHNMVNDIYEAPDGKLYVAENNGSIDVMERDAFTTEEKLPNAIINQFYTTKDQRVIAVTDGSGFLELRNGKLVKPQQAFPNSTYNDIANLNDSLLIAGAEGSLRILDNHFNLVSEIYQRREVLTFKIYVDSDNNTWIGTNYGLKLVTFGDDHLSGKRFTLSSAPFDIPQVKNRIINDILEDWKGNLWIATTHGLVLIEKNGSWEVFSEKNGLPSSEVTCLYQDIEKNIWVGTALGLVKLVTKNDIRIYSFGEGHSNSSVKLLHRLSGDEFFLATESGIRLYNARTEALSVVSTQHHLTYGGVVKNSYPLLFFAYNNNFGRYDTTKQHIIEATKGGRYNSNIYYSVMDANGIIFNGTHTGIDIHTGNKVLPLRKFPHRVTAFHIDKKGYLWVGTWDDGLFRMEYSNVRDESAVKIKDYSGLIPGKNIRCLFEDHKGNIWVGTRYHGIAQLKPLNNENYSSKYISMQEGLMSNWGRVIAEDKRGTIWVGTPLGLDKILPAGENFRVFNFSRVNNYFADINDIVTNEDGSLWLTTSIGMSRIIDGETENTIPAPVYITSVSLGDTSFNYNTYNRNSSPRLRFNQNQARFEFSAPGFINEKLILYSYRLLGTSDTTWSPPDNLHNVSYASLQPGNYRFEVRTIGWNGLRGKAEFFTFSIRPPYWQTWGFYLLTGLAILFLLYALYRYRIGQLLNLQKVRNRIATDLHDDIGSTLTNINMLSEISRKNLSQPKEAERFLQRISDEVTDSSQALNDIIWSVNSRNDSLEETLSRMRRYAADLFENSGTTFHLNLDENVGGKKLNMEQRRDVYLIYKEALNNIRKHAAAKNVWIDTQWHSGKLYMKIKDDGKGFEPSGITNRNGLKNIRSRTEKWKGSSSIVTGKGAGTVIEIIIPISG